MTLDIMVFVVASIVLFQFQPITAIMIVALALLDDIPIMTIAYDNMPAPPKPVRWDMQRILLFASIMGLLSVAETFGLLLIGCDGSEACPRKSSPIAPVSIATTSGDLIDPVAADKPVGLWRGER